MSLSGAGLVLLFWPLSLLGVVFAGLFSSSTLAILLGILFDVAYGPPSGILHFLYFPFTTSALLAILLRLFGARFLLGKTPQERL